MINKTAIILQVVLLYTCPLLAMESEEAPRTLNPKKGPKYYVMHPIERVRNSPKYGVIPSMYLPWLVMDDVNEQKDQEHLSPIVTNDNTEEQEEVSLLINHDWREDNTSGKRKFFVGENAKASCESQQQLRKMSLDSHHYLYYKKLDEENTTKPLLNLQNVPTEEFPRAQSNLSPQQ